MPFDGTLVVMIAGLVIALAVWFKTRRLGPVVAVLFTAFVVMAFTDRSILTRGAQAVGDAVTWFFDTILTLG